MVRNMRWTLVEQGENPSSDYFVKPALSKELVKSVHLFDQPSSVDLSAKQKPDIVFVRYLTGEWRSWVEQNRNRIGRLAFFMDDDLFDMSVHAGLPLRYRWKLYYFAYRYQKWLGRMGAELWVSNDYLQEKYQGWKPTVLKPQSPYAEESRHTTVFYHGSASHKQEINWLLPVIEAVLQANPDVAFEIIGDAETRKKFSHLPRVNVLYPMTWCSYKGLVNRPGRDIGLAPLLSSGFNNARSATKFFDITQAGAVGIYADHPIYETLIRDNINGFILPMQQEQWISKIQYLVKDEKSRATVHSNACQYL